MEDDITGMVTVVKTPDYVDYPTVEKIMDRNDTRARNALWKEPKLAARKAFEVPKKERPPRITKKKFIERLE